MPVDEIFTAISDSDTDVEDYACIRRRFALPVGYGNELHIFVASAISDLSPIVDEQDDLMQLRLAIETSDDTTDYDEFRQELGLD